VDADTCAAIRKSPTSESTSSPPDCPLHLSGQPSGSPVHPAGNEHPTRRQIRDSPGPEGGLRNRLRCRVPQAHIHALLHGALRSGLSADLHRCPVVRSATSCAVAVHPSSTRSHYLARAGETDGTYVRVGSTNRRADHALIEELKRYERNESFDEQPMPELDSEAIDFRAASEFFAPVRKLVKQDLLTLGVLVRHQGRLVPTVGGLLCLARRELATSPMPGFRLGGLPGRTRPRSSTTVSCGAIRSLQSTRRWRSSRGTHTYSPATARRTYHSSEWATELRDVPRFHDWQSSTRCHESGADGRRPSRGQQRAVAEFTCCPVSSTLPAKTCSAS